jgi:hypothetical protein
MEVSRAEATNLASACEGEMQENQPDTILF